MTLVWQDFQDVIAILLRRVQLVLAALSVFLQMEQRVSAWVACVATVGLDLRIATFATPIEIVFLAHRMAAMWIVPNLTCV